MVGAGACLRGGLVGFDGFVGVAGDLGQVVFMAPLTSMVGGVVGGRGRWRRLSRREPGGVRLGLRRGVGARLLGRRRHRR